MTRINVVPVEELSDQHLIAEYRELPRVIKQNIDVSDAPEKYCLGKRHMKWGRKHWAYCFLRFNELVREMAIDYAKQEFLEKTQKDQLEYIDDGLIDCLSKDDLCEVDELITDEVNKITWRTFNPVGWAV